MVCHAFFPVNGKCTQIVTERKKLAVVTRSRRATNGNWGRNKSESDPRYLQSYSGSFRGNAIGLPALHRKSYHLHVWFGPPDAGLWGVRSSPRGWIESTE